jgi:DNA invertase Pin-like site-specific DNA recombinase
MEKAKSKMTQQESKNAIVYLRVSTEEQVDNYSLSTQEDICIKEAQRKGLTIVKTFREEGRSAKTIDGRPQLIEMLEFCRKYKKDIGAVIIYRLDRISRQTADYLAIRKKLAECEIKLISATEPTGNSPTEKFVETMLAGFAQMDNDVRSERTKNGMRARFLSGLSNGYVPLGYISKDGYAVKDPETFDKLKAGWELMAVGTKTLLEMTEILNKQGLKAGYGSHKHYPLRPQTLSRIFRNKFYTGKIVSDKYNEEVQGQHPPMVTEEVFYRVQAIIDGRNTNIALPVTRRNRDNPDFPLRRIVKCGCCGSSFTGGKSRGKRLKYGYYFCQKRCKGSNVSVSRIEDETQYDLRGKSPKDNTLDLFVAYVRSTYYKRVSSLEKRRKQADEDLAKLYKFRQALIEKNLSGVYSDEIFKEQNKIVENKIKTIQVTKNDEMINKYNIEDIINFVKNKLQDLSQTYLESSLRQKRALLCSIYPSGLVWGENGYSNTVISQYWSAILDISDIKLSFGSRRV